MEKVRKSFDLTELSVWLILRLVSLLYLQKSYPGEIGYEDGKFLFPLTQQETFRLPKLCQMQVRVKFKSGDVIGSEIKQIDVAHALSKAVL
mgnify:CR=1 FL=1